MGAQQRDRNVGRPNGVKATVPKDIDRVREIIRRRAAGESFAAIGKTFGITRMGALLLHKRWKGQV